MKIGGRIGEWAVAMTIVAGLTTATGAVMPAFAGDQIRIVGSSTIFPFAAAVAEHFAKGSGFSSPVVESLGSGGGLKLFCADLGEGSPDIATASRRIQPREREVCAANGITDIAEIQIGYDGIALMGSRQAPHLDLSREELFRAIAKLVPIDGKLVPNPYHSWKDIADRLPDREIMVFGPAPNHGSRDMLGPLVMDPVCDGLAATRSLAPEAKRRLCRMMREDGAFIEVTESYSVVVRKLLMEPRALAILPFGYFDRNAESLQAATLDGRPASFDSILSGAYPLSRPLFLYVKTAHLPLTPGLRQYVAEFTSEAAWGPNGYLVDKGLIPMADAARRTEAAKAAQLTGR